MGQTIVDVLEMAKPEIDRQKQVDEIVKRLRLLKKAGKNNEEIVEVIKSLDLPLGLHLYLMGNFSKLITF